LSHIALAQYPVKRIFKGDSVVIMRVSQADTINLLYKNYNDTITDLKNLITQKRFQYDSINKEIRFKQDSFYNWKWKYEANRAAYIGAEKENWKKEKLHEASKLILVGIIILQLQTISHLQNKIR
jgi:hypothetical protein